MQVHFIISSLSETHLKDIISTDLENDFPYWLGGEVAWCAKFYMMLREHRSGISIGNRPLRDTVNIAHLLSWRALGPRTDEYRVAIRADFRRILDVDFEILQNPTMVRTDKQAYVDHWLPRITPRDSTRLGVKTVAYAGRIGSRNIERSLLASNSAVFKDCNFKVVQGCRWHDMRDVDVLLAIRDFSKRTHDSKPPSKLINAWQAEVPLIAGCDSAFAAIGQPGVDYLRVTSKEELIDALLLLRNDHDVYHSIVNSGRRQAKRFTREKVTSSWLTIIDGPISRDFELFCMSRRSRALARGGLRVLDGVLDAASAGKAMMRSATRLLGGNQSR